MAGADHAPAELAYRGGEQGAAGQDYDVGFFFEYEIQLMDQASHQRSLSGPASHEAYKRRQVDTARLRVFGRALLDWIAAHDGGATDGAADGAAGPAADGAAR